MSLGDIILTLLKIVVALAIIVWVCYYWVNQGPPPRGRGRWRNVLQGMRKGRHHDET